MSVYDRAIERIESVFNEFDNVSISFSGGKDSGVMLNLTLEVAKRLNRLSDVSIFHIDYEAQYSFTTDYVERVKANLPEAVKFHHICLPIKAQCATSMFQDHWKPWNPEDKELWVRELPEDAISTKNNPFDFFKEQWDYDFQEKYGAWLHKTRNAKRTAILVGIRAQESLNRWRAIHSYRNYRNYKGLNYTRKVDDDVYNIYPIYDWKTEDIWIANGRFGWDYNKIYDLYYQAGLEIDQMRVASPFNDSAQGTLALYRTIEPNMWGKMVSRVNGVNFTGIYGGTTAMGWRSITKPKHLSWKEYMEFLLDTLPENVRQNYLNKLNTSIKFWKERGGVLPDDVIKELDELGVKYEFGRHNYNSDKKAVKMDYMDDLGIKDFKLIPTYKRMCVCILKNDHACKYMGFSQTKTEIEKRKKAIEHYAKTL